MRNLFYDSYDGLKRIVKFQCDKCNCTEFNRPKSISYLRKDSFFEGFFNCDKCKKEHDYSSNSFYSKKIINPQLSIF